MVVYKVINLINNKIYIGKDSKNDPEYMGSGLLIIKAFKKYGKHKFKKEILSFCESEQDMCNSEIFWINKLNSTDKSIGYNIALGGNGGGFI